MVIGARSLISKVADPKSFVLTINAGSVSADHWTQDPSSGGGRLLGEGCHFIDLLRYLAGAPIEGFDIVSARKHSGPPRADTAILSLRFANGSIGAVNYFSDGHRGVPKERLEIYCGGRILVLDNYRRLTLHGWHGVSGMRSWRQDKGQAACARAFIEAVKNGGPAPIPLDEIIEVSRISIEAASRT